MNKPIKLIWDYRKILYSITYNDIKAKYAGSLLGIIWAVLYPVLFLSVYFVVYIKIFDVRLPTLGTVDYVMLIFCGLVPWLGFAESLGNGVNAVISNSGLIKNTLFPIELMPVKTVLSSLVSQFIGLIMLMLIFTVRGNIGIYIVLLPYMVILQFAFTCGLVWILSSLNVFFRDLSHGISVIIILLMMLSPIAYTSDMLSEKIMDYMRLNPIYYMINIYRDILMYNRMPAMADLLIFTGLAFALFTIGYNMFIRLKVVFSDYV